MHDATHPQQPHPDVLHAPERMPVPERMAVPPDDLRNRFRAHATDVSQQARMNQVRDACRLAAFVINEAMHPCREASTALTKIEEAMFHANAGIARHG